MEGARGIAEEAPEVVLARYAACREQRDDAGPKAERKPGIEQGWSDGDGVRPSSRW